MKKYDELSRVVSHALRHEPWLYELELDEDGWVPVNILIAGLGVQNPTWLSLSEGDLEEMIALSAKKRHELRDGRIRALYGHSTPQKLLKEAAQPPARLYHGTAPETAVRIRSQGLHPMGRQYVHLSADGATAKEVGKRKSRDPVILTVRADDAHRAGVRFYRGNDHVWLADMIAAEFIGFAEFQA